MRTPTSVLLALTFAATLGACKKDQPQPDPPKDEEKIACGGFAGTPCPDGLVCVDDPADDCDPEQGGADCMGMCVESDEGPGKDEPGEKCDFDADPDKTYVGESPEQCAVIKFACDEGKQYFADDCGCGCETAGESQAEAGGSGW